ncbi:hypothetical protein ACFW6V_40005 [Streptomyces sp. NPDC058734]|uniref:hypothetical protein n=1 Tax=Streptomyces sp. NPDC058734 TaxID=3346615 RepID=UPI003673FD36
MEDWVAALCAKADDLLAEPDPARPCLFGFAQLVRTPWALVRRDLAAKISAARAIDWQGAFRWAE